MAMTGQRRDVFSAYYFVVEIEGDRFATFRSAGGLKSEAEVVPMQQGGVNALEHRLIGRTKFPNIVLKQGFSGSKMWDKRTRYATDDLTPIRRFNGTIIQMGPGNKEVHRWQFTKGWICKWDGPEFDATKNEISLEAIEIAHEGLTLVGA
ncbi:MAG TPA: phage tail protein, partial [Pseudomonadota bacterium]|nr:phage tail protein [Pseudomonadota bacterium]